MAERTILVTGATGRQGSAAVRHLLNAGFSVRAMTRNPDSSKAKDIKTLGAQLVKADYDDLHSLKQAIEGVYGVFSVQDFWAAGFEGEIRQGKVLAELAVKEKVEHIVYSSVCGAERNSGVSHFETKWQIELHMQGLQAPVTVLRPVFFMESFFEFGFLQNDKLTMALHPGTTHQMVAVDDIGAFVALAFKQPDKWKGQALEIASDAMTMLEAAKVFSSVLGRAITFEPVPVEVLKEQNEEMGLMFEWFNEKGPIADLQYLRQLHPGLLSLEQWLKRYSLASVQ